MSLNPRQLSSLSINSSRPSTSKPLSPSQTSPKASESPGAHVRQRYCFSDPVAFLYLSDDPVANIIDAKHELTGYQSYVVEQWAVSRTHPTMVITAYTGDPSHKIQVGILSVPADEGQWSPRLRVYFRSLAQYHARSKETPLGKIMVTNLSGFSSSLSIIPIPDGELRKNREMFHVNEDLKRLGCSGRMGLTLADPTPSTVAKFYQLFKISTKVPIKTAVIELVSLCQVALNLFGCLATEYVDGLLCDKTEEAVNEWWTKIGTEVYNVDPNDGALGPITVAGLLGLLMGARNRLAAFGAPVSKDVFDIDITKRAIAYFQKTQGMPRTKRLDRYTIHQLHRATVKQASGEGWKMSRAVKSTVADLGGKGGEMVMEMVARDKAKIADVETVDIDVFAQEVKGSHALWLWQGKPKRRTTRDMFSEDVASPQAAAEGNNERRSHEHGRASRPNGLSLHQRSQTSESIAHLGDDEDPAVAQSKGRAVLSKAKGRLKDAVGKRPGSYRHNTTSMPKEARNKSRESLHSSTSPAAQRQSARSSDTGIEHTPTELPSILRTTTSGQEESASATDLSRMSTNKTPSDAELLKIPSGPSQRSQKLGDPIHLSDSEVSPANTAEPSVAGDDDDYHNTDLEDDADPNCPSGWQRPSTLFQRTKSFLECEDKVRLFPIEDPPPKTSPSRKDESSHNEGPFRNDDWWPRHLSFSAAEDTLYNSQSTFAINENDERLSGHPRQELLRELLLADEARDLNTRLKFLYTRVAPAVRRKRMSVEKLDDTVASDVDQLNSLYHPRKEEYSALDAGSHEILSEERIRLREAVEDVETLGAKLEYEIQGLRSKVEDVEEAVKEYAQQVAYTESRVNELVYDDSAHGWWGWIVNQFVDTRKQGQKPPASKGPNGTAASSAPTSQK